MIAKLSEAMGAALVSNNFSPIPSKISFHIEKKVTRCSPTSKKIKTFWTVELRQYLKSGSTFSSNEQLAGSSDCSRVCCY